MNTSIFLAKLLGPIMLVLGSTLAVNSRTYTAMATEFVQSRPLVYLAGVAALTGGLAIVLNHNRWVADWPIIITLFGWLAMVGGFLRLMFPDIVRRVGRRMLANNKTVLIAGIVWAVLGAVLCFAGYRSFVSG